MTEGCCFRWAVLLAAVLGASPPAWCADTKPPNVLMIAVDDLNDWVGFLKGHPQVKTPHMDRLARRGMVFANAHCAAPLCCPSRAALFSGRQPFRTGIYDNGQNIRQHHPDLVLLPQYFARHGYRTLAAGKLLHHASPDLYDEYFATEQRWSPLRNANQAAYTDGELARKATDLRHAVLYGANNRMAVLPLNRMPSDRNPAGAAGESFDWGPFDIDEAQMGDGKIATWAVDRIGRLSDRPQLWCVGFYRPHIPLWAPRRYFDLYPIRTTILPEVLKDDLEDLSPVGRRWALEPVTAGRIRQLWRMINGRRRSQHTSRVSRSSMSRSAG